jgi:hypothetical protein
MTTGEARELRVNCGPFEKIFEKPAYSLRGFLPAQAAPVPIHGPPVSALA